MTENVTDKKKSINYWQSNLKLLFSLLFVWFIVSFGCGILWVDWLDQFTFFGFNLGFWFAQQGSIYIFVVLIFIYCWQMSQLEKKIYSNQIVESTKKNKSDKEYNFE
jgi:putative solute:sodium symporter small subunit